MTVEGRSGETTEERFALACSDLPSRPVVAWTDLSGKRTAALAERTLAGAAAQAGLVVNDPTVSRIHAEFELRHDGVWVKDLGSKNGTYVEGVLVTGARVPRKGRVRLGSCVLVLDYEEARETVEVWPDDHFGGMAGASVVMRQLFARLSRVAKTTASVLVHGETGTGKELVARAVHDASPRSAGPFVVVDCAAIPENLVESQLFGHAKGAFTGALAARVGDIEAADGGTVFLDEIGELPATMQPKLLRVLESRTLRRVGETQERKIDVRFVFATHRDLRRMVNEGAFREDLYFRLAVVPVSVPPLRERLEDLPALVQRFLPAGSATPLSPELAGELAKRPWLGNVRELRNFVERALAIGTREALSLAAEEAAAPAASVDEPVPFVQRFKDFREQWLDHGEREYVKRLLARHDRNVAVAAAEAGVDRTYIYRLIRKHAL
jgi:transcriptional regulator with GAF, ATPase, and Fis domain